MAVTLTESFLFLSVVKVVFASHDSAQKIPSSRLPAADHQNLQFTQVTLLLCLQASHHPYENIDSKQVDNSVLNLCHRFLLSGKENVEG